MGWFRRPITSYQRNPLYILRLQRQSCGQLRCDRRPLPKFPPFQALVLHPDSDPSAIMYITQDSKDRCIKYTGDNRTTILRRNFKARCSPDRGRYPPMLLKYVNATLGRSLCSSSGSARPGLAEPRWEHTGSHSKYCVDCLGILRNVRSTSHIFEKSVLLQPSW